MSVVVEDMFHDECGRYKYSFLRNQVFIFNRNNAGDEGEDV
jgi:hypothetical protein